MPQMIQAKADASHVHAAVLHIASNGLDRLEDAGLLLTPAGTFLAANAAGARLLESVSSVDLEQLAAEIAAGPVGREVRIGGGASPRCWKISTLGLADEAGFLVLIRDETLEREIREAMIDSRHRYRDFTDMCGSLAWEAGPDGRLTFVSPRGGLGYTAAELLYADPSQLFADALDGRSNPFTTTEHLRSVEMPMVSKGGQTRTMLVSACPLRNSAGRFLGVRGLCQDITALRKSEAAQQYAEWQFAAITDAAAALQAGLAADGETVRLAPIVQSVFGAEVVHILHRVHEEEAARGPTKWTVVDESITCSVSGINPLRVAALADEPHAVTMINHDGWIVLAAPVGGNPTQADLVLIWRRASYGAWTPMHSALAAAIAPILSIGITKTIPASPSEVFDESMGSWSFRTIVSRHVRRAAVDKKSSCLLVIAANPHDRWAFQCDPIPRIAEALGQSVRAADAVGVLSRDRIAVWLDDTTPDSVHDRCAELIATAEQVLGVLRIVPHPFHVMHCILSVDADAAMSGDDLLLRAATVAIAQPTPNLETTSNEAVMDTRHDGTA